jgi:hypothetical protein
MTKLEDHIVEIEGKQYVPYDIAQIVMYESTLSELEKAQVLIKDAFKDLNNTLSDIDE